MNIVERTTAQLVRNRIHDLVDLAMDVNANNTGTAAIRVLSDAAYVDIHSDMGSFHSTYPLPLMATNRTLDELEKIIADARDFLGGAQ
ncbi:hypothetical protein CZ787_17240 [Halomonas citrativorans]|uniref:Uncharacterized protein n=1 Tax=Halomonas citrativorans TaxID=2742612 RepID=A0A1R4I584_9GAMM|nr:hypothetical protein [Halomonas citrativorans]SJN14856.1 hypothetical protein CZ787_17240 [Halomonas citrativorans]